jgi:hypothetical protein
LIQEFPIAHDMYLISVFTQDKMTVTVGALHFGGNKPIDENLALYYPITFDYFAARCQETAHPCSLWTALDHVP